MIKVIVGGVVLHGGRAVLVQEAKPEARGLLNLPAGRLEPEETLQAGAIREIQEETGLRVTIPRQLGVFQHFSNTANVVNVLFDARTGGSDLSPPPGEILAPRWFSLEEIRALSPEQFRSPDIPSIVERALKGDNLIYSEENNSK